jgi:hypothetical protein
MSLPHRNGGGFGQRASKRFTGFSVKPLAFLGRDALVFLGETNQL